MVDFTKKLSPHLFEWEMACGQKNGCEFCNGSLPLINVKLISGFEKLRELIGKPIRVTSGYRCVARNMDAKSQHCKGTAMDLWVPTSEGFLDCLTLFNFAEQVEEFNLGGLGIYPSKLGNGKADFIHVDVRGKKARWGRIYVNKKPVYRDITQVMAML